MRSFIGWLRLHDKRMLLWTNSRPAHITTNHWITRWFSTITHMGGATFTLVTALLTALLAPNPWKSMGVQCLAAIIASHLPVAFVKRTIKRLRPYQALQGVKTYKRRLADSSFPSGHTTAVFAWLMPILLTVSNNAPQLMPIVLPLGLIIGLSVGYSRMFLRASLPF